jgi:alcohol dehydrogenase class IV
MMAYNLDYCRQHYARIATAMGLTYGHPEEGAQQAVQAIRQLALDVKLPSFRNLGVKHEDFEELAHKSAINGSNPDNPRPMQKEDYMSVLNTLWNAS